MRLHSLSILPIMDKETFSLQKRAFMDFNQFEPCFLIAMPDLKDPNFEKTVVLLTDYNDDGASGFIINRTSDIHLGSAIMLPEGNLNPDYQDYGLWFAGPVDLERVWVLYDPTKYSDPDSGVEISKNLNIAKDIDILTNAEQTIDSEHIKILHGYSGWAKDQLDQEIASSFWITAPISNDLIFNKNPEKIWEVAIKKLGFDASKLMAPKSSFVN